MSKTSIFFGVIAVVQGATYKILGEDVLFLTLTETLIILSNILIYMHIGKTVVYSYILGSEFERFATMLATIKRLI